MKDSKQTQINKDVKVNPSRILQVGMGFMASKTLLTAVKLELFTNLASQSLTGREIRHRLGLHERGLYDFLDALVALGFLQKSGTKETAVYSNSPDAETFLDKCKLTYMGGLLEMANSRLYSFWNYLEDALRTGKPQNETRMGRSSLFDEIYTDKSKAREFINAMGGAQSANFNAFAVWFDFARYNSLCDIGGAGAQLSIEVVKHNSHMKCISFDLPQVAPIALENLSKFGIADKVEIVSGDFFKDPFPEADVITMGNVLQVWGAKEKNQLIHKAYEALPKGGSFVVIENIIDNERKENVSAMMMSLNMLIESSEGYDMTFEELDALFRDAGFIDTYVIPLAGNASAAVAVK